MSAIITYLRHLTIKSKMTLLMVIVLAGYIISAAGGIVLMNRSSGRTLFIQIGAYKDALEQSASLKAELNSVRLALVTMLHEKDVDKISKLQKQMKTNAEDIDAAFETIGSGIDDEELNTAMHDAKLTWAEFQKTQNNELLPAFASGNAAKALELASGLQRMRYERFSEQVGNAVDTTRLKIADLEKSALKAAKQNMIILGASSVILLIVSLAIIILITKSILVPLSEAVKFANTVAGGDLSVALQDGGGKDEIGALTAAINSMVSAFNEMLVSVQTASGSVTAAVDVLRQATESTSTGAKNQAAQASQIAATAEEMSQTITDIAKNATEAAVTAETAMKTAEEGKTIAGGAVETVDKVYSTTVELSAMVEKLNKGAVEIGDIVTLIKGIADQTNLLALNAAIEAARAGDQGRGFAVVADEVRKLAEKTIKATDDISSKINGIQADSTMTTKSMAEASKEVTQATALMKNVGDSLNSIVSAVQKVRSQITHIATAVEEQSAASEDVAANIEKTSAIARETESKSSHVLHEVSTLYTIAETLRNNTAKFKVHLGELTIVKLAKTDHRIFLQKISACRNGAADPSCAVDQLPDHRSCRFGKWYFGEDGRNFAGLASFQAINPPHERFHVLAKAVITAHNSGDHAKADGLFEEMETLSDAIVQHLDEIQRESTKISR